ncbi:hypothetical protein POM88_017793 [Heracleum sosnowskyi]|uniref:Uncharacterized protein n=1 Tax=Heracleum sosnowskyi TaxID=360622 RepID=A0AAD8IPV0_9APIA|nr:hypothetical protein POM88_017793 [Heracleum sosnowskyi]
MIGFDFGVQFVIKGINLVNHEILVHGGRVYQGKITAGPKFHETVKFEPLGSLKDKVSHYGDRIMLTRTHQGGEPRSSFHWARGSVPNTMTHRPLISYRQC